MAVKDSHGVVVAAYAPTSGYHRDHGVPAIHRPDYRDGLSTLASGDWELFPNLDVAPGGRTSYLPELVPRRG